MMSKELLSELTGQKSAILPFSHSVSYPVKGRIKQFSSKYMIPRIKSDSCKKASRLQRLPRVVIIPQLA